MGAFIPVKIDDPVQVPDYAEELKLLTRELENHQALGLSKFCSSRGIPYQGFKSYLEKNGVSLRLLRMKTGQSSDEPSAAEVRSEALSGVSIKLPNLVEVTIPSVLPSQLSDLLKLL